MVHAGNWTQVTWMKCPIADHYTIHTLLSEEVDFNKMKLNNKSSNITNPSIPQIEMIYIDHKSLPIIIGP